MPHRVLARHQYSITSLAVVELAGRPAIVSADSGGVVQVHDLATGTPIGRPLSGDRDGISKLGITKLDGRLVILAGENGYKWQTKSVVAWDISTGTPVGRPRTGHAAGVSALAAFQLKGRTMLLSGDYGDYGDDAKVRIWDMARPNWTRRIVARNTPYVSHLGFAELDGRPRILTVLGGHYIWIFDLVTRRPIDNSNVGNVLALSELDGRPVVIAEAIGEISQQVRPDAKVYRPEAGPVEVWDLVTGTRIGQPLPRFPMSSAIAIAATMEDRAVIVVGETQLDLPGEVRIWDLANGTPIGRPLTGHEGNVSALAAAQIGGRSVVITGDGPLGGGGTVRVWELADGTTSITQPPTGDERKVTALTSTQVNDHPVIITGDDHGTIQVRDSATGTPIGEPLLVYERTVTGLAATQLNNRPIIVVQDSQGRIRLQALSAGTLSSPDERATALTIAQLDDHPVIIIGDDDGTIQVRDLATNEPIGQALTVPEERVTALATALLNDNLVIIAGYESSGFSRRSRGESDLTVRIWDPAAGSTILQPLTTHGTRILAAAAIQQGPRLIVIFSDESLLRGTVRRLELDISNPEARMSSWPWKRSRPLPQATVLHTGAPLIALSIAEIQGEHRIIAGSRDGIVWLYDLRGSLRRTIELDHAITALTLADDATLVAGGPQGLVALRLSG